MDQQVRTAVVGFIHELAFADLPPSVVEQAKRCLTDLVGVAAAGARTPSALIVRDYAAGHLATPGGGARLFFDGRRASSAGAAYADAAVIDSYDAHEGHNLTKGHVGVAILPALAAVADAGARIDGREFLTALVVGYEIATRAGIALHATVSDYHTSGAWNALGCAAVAARLLKLDETRTREALGIAEYHGPRSQMMRCIDHPTMIKDGSGFGAFAGVSAAHLAAAGFTGAPALTVEGAEVRGIWADLGSRWMLLEQYFKPYPVCRWAQPPVEAARELVQRHAFTHEDIDAIRVDTFAEAARLDTPEPADTDGAQYSLPFALAAFLVRGRLTADEIIGPALRDETIRDLARRIEPVADPELAGRYPAERVARITVALKDGRSIASDVHHPRGTAEEPLGAEEFQAKFEGAVAYLGAERAASVKGAVEGIEDGPGSVEHLLDAILAPPSP
jgi:2-methylcitrate dehydratase PrpD